MKARSPRLSVRAIILGDNRLLLVNAYPGDASDLWCAPGGGVHPGASLPDNLRREVHEETGLTVNVGPLALVNEFHDSRTGFHQVDLFFRCTIAGGAADAPWVDPAGVVHRRRFFSRSELAAIRLKPDSLPVIAWRAGPGAHYDPLEEIAP